MSLADDITSQLLRLFKWVFVVVYLGFVWFIYVLLHAISSAVFKCDSIVSWIFSWTALSCKVLESTFNEVSALLRA